MRSRSEFTHYCFINKVERKSTILFYNQDKVFFASNIPDCFLSLGFIAAVTQPPLLLIGVGSISGSKELERGTVGARPNVYEGGVSEGVRAWEGAQVLAGTGFISK